uniref:Uncharacterized protein n=1 Tax=Calidris pygmaea TaxID=425635 RepID=A0A8C3JE83_9CHAR
MGRRLKGSPEQELRIVLLGLDNEVSTITPTQVGAAGGHGRWEGLQHKERPLARLQAERLGYRGAALHPPILEEVSGQH